MAERKPIRFTLNGSPVEALAATNENAIELLQRDFALSGARVSCAQGLCGCCTIEVDGVAASGCLLLAPFLDGCEVKTVESLADGDTLDPIQQAFLDHAAFQCGFCTPGFIMMTRELLARIPDPTDEEIKHYLSGNLCRCAAYPEIVRAVRAAASGGAATPQR
jgi:aerobic-type carbon monoxide dehydrogenase small subunit (CoxS/CutS family)